jgi:hypothetical protein
LAGKTYYKDKSAGGEPAALFIPSKYLMVLTNLVDKELEAILTADGNKLVPPADLMAMVNRVRPSTFWLVAPYDPSLSQNLQNGSGAGATNIPGLDLKALQAAMTGAKAIGMWAGVENNQATMSIGFQFSDAAGTGKLATELEKAWRLVKGFAGLALLGMNNQPQFVKDGVKELMNNTKVSSQDNLAKISTQLSLGLVKKAIEEMQKAGAGMRLGNPAVPGQPGPGPAIGPGNAPRPNKPVVPKPGGPPRGGKGAVAPGGPGN